MKTRQEALNYGLSFPNTYQEAPFHDPNWQLIRVKDSKKAFLWTYERNGFINLNVKVSPAWRDFWRDAFPSVIPGWHQNKDNWNTIILDGSIPDDAIKNMIADSYDLVTYNPTQLIYEAVKRIPSGADEQANRLRADGIEVIDGRVDLDKYGIRIADDVIYTKTTVEPLT